MTPKDIAVMEAKEKLARKASVFKQVFNTPDGKQALNILEQEFNRLDIFEKGAPDATAYNLGRRDVVVYINQLLRYGQNED